MARWLKRLAWIYVALVGVFLFFPVLVITPISFSGDRFMHFPPETFGLRWYSAFFSDPVWVGAALRSLRIAFFAAITASMAGTAFVLWMRSVPRSLEALASGTALSPAVIPNVVISLGIFLIAVYFGFNDTEAALVLAHAVLGLPFVVLVVGAGLKQCDHTLERAARIMGAGPIRAFFTGIFPSLLPAILAAALFAFFISLDELIVALFLMGQNVTLPMQIWADLQFEINPTIAAVSVLFIILTTIGLTAAELLRRRSVSDR